MVFMIVKGSVEIMDKAFTPDINWDPKAQLHATVTKTAKTPPPQGK